MNVTLSTDGRLLERARKLASQRGTTLNAMIRELLEQVTASSAPENLLPELGEGRGDQSVPGVNG